MMLVVAVEKKVAMTGFSLTAGANHPGLGPLILAGQPNELPKGTAIYLLYFESHPDSGRRLQNPSK